MVAHKMFCNNELVKKCRKKTCYKKCICLRIFFCKEKLFSLTKVWSKKVAKYLEKVLNYALSAPFGIFNIFRLHAKKEKSPSYKKTEYTDAIKEGLLKYRFPTIFA